MASRFTDRALTARILPADFARRMELAREPQPDDARGPRALLLLREFAWPYDALKAKLGTPDIARSARPRMVMLLPGFGAHPVRMRYMARQLERGGHVVKRWGRGWNLGASQECFEVMEARLVDLHSRCREPVALVGWSLGGVFARELAKLHPDKVDKVVTLGSPFSGSPRANNGWRIYQAVAGHRVDESPVEAEVAQKPPVETVAYWSARDGVVHPRSASGRTDERDRAYPLRCTHMGFVYEREAIEAVAGELHRG